MPVSSSFVGNNAVNVVSFESIKGIGDTGLLISSSSLFATSLVFSPFIISFVVNQHIADVKENSINLSTINYLIAKPLIGYSFDIGLPFSSSLYFSQFDNPLILEINISKSSFNALSITDLSTLKGIGNNNNFGLDSFIILLATKGIGRGNNFDTVQAKFTDLAILFNSSLFEPLSSKGKEILFTSIFNIPEKGKGIEGMVNILEYIFTYVRTSLKIIGEVGEDDNFIYIKKKSLVDVGFIPEENNKPESILLALILKVINDVQSSTIKHSIWNQTHIEEQGISYKYTVFTFEAKNNE